MDAAKDHNDELAQVIYPQLTLLRRPVSSTASVSGYYLGLQQLVQTYRNEEEDVLYG